MAWVRIDDAFDANRKVKRLWRRCPEALGLHVMAITYGATTQPVGRIDLEWVREMVPNPRRRTASITALLESGLWILDDPDDPEQWELDLDASGIRYVVHRRSSIRGWLRRVVIDRDGYVCGLCGGDVEPADVHIDHILPVAHGGSEVVHNLQVTHSRCNLRKGADA